MNRSFLLSLATSAFTGAVGFYAGSLYTAQTPAIPMATLPGVSPAPQLVEPPRLRIAIVDVKRLFDIHPSRKASEDAINAKRLTYKAEWQRLTDSGDAEAAKRFGDAGAKELQEEADRRREQIMMDVRQHIEAVASSRNFDLVLDSSGKTPSGVPIVLHSSGYPDITDDIAHEPSP